MKKYLLIALLLTSCAREKRVDEQTAVTRGYIKVDVSAYDSKGESKEDIESIRFMIFDDLDSSPRIEVNDQRTRGSQSQGIATGLQALFQVRRTDKLVVAIINEPTDLYNDLEEVETLADLAKIDIPLSKLLSTNHSELATQMPMSGAVRVSKTHVQVNTGTAEADRQPIMLDRAMACVEVMLTTTIEDGIELETGSKITLRNTFTSVPLVYHPNLVGRLQFVPTGNFTSREWSVDLPGAPNKVHENTEELFVRFYTPERQCKDDKLAVEIALKTPDGNKSANIVLDQMFDEKGATAAIDTVRRNRRYVVRGRVTKAPEIAVPFAATVVPWQQALEPTELGPHVLVVEKSRVVFTAEGGVVYLNVECDTPGGWQLDDVSNLSREVAAVKFDDKTLMVAVNSVTAATSTEVSWWCTLRSGNLRKRIVIVRQAKLSHYLSVSPKLLEFSAIAERQQQLTINTNYPGGWRTDPHISQWPEWVTEQLFVGHGAAGNISVENIQPHVNTDDVAREFKFEITAGDNLSEEITIRQAANRHVFAASGIPGIRLSDLRSLLNARFEENNPALLDPTVSLTLKGSSTYKGTMAEGASVEFGGLESEPVYTTYYFWGSTVAMLFAADAPWHGDGSDVVWVNPSFGGSTQGAWHSAATFTAASPKGSMGNNDITDNAQKGHGDICTLVNPDYRTPPGNPWRTVARTPFGDYHNQAGVNYLSWTDSRVKAIRLDKETYPDYYIKTGVSPNLIIIGRDIEIFLPAAGFVEETKAGKFGQNVEYWTSTWHSNGLPMQLFGSNVGFTPSGVASTVASAYPIRCVKIKEKGAV